MPTPKRRTGLLWIMVVAAITLSALAGGWWVGRRQAGELVREDPKRVVLTKEAARLRLRLERGEAAEADQQRLLELLVGLDRKGEAIALLEPMADREPERWSLRLMLAELRRDQNDRSGAERELRQILSRQPTQVEALQLMALLKLEEGKSSEAEAQVKAAFTSATRTEVKPDALGVGLLLAELQQKRGQSAQAEATYQQLVVGFPLDQRPLIALALLRHELGNSKGAMEALSKARLRSPDPGKPDPKLDKLAASWGLAALRAPAASGSALKPPLPAAPPTGHRSP